MNLLRFTCLLVAIAEASAIVNSRATHEDIGVASYFNKTTSSFVKIIKTEDVRDRDAIYVNAAVLFIGKENGEILKCLQAEHQECEVFYTANSKVPALLVTGEYLFASLFSGLILRCDLYTQGSCNTFYTGTSEMLSLSADGGYLYASLYTPPTILRCNLNQPNSCRSHIAMKKSYMWAFSHFGKYIYAGQENGEVVRCSLRASSSCTVIYSMGARVYGFANIEDSIYAVTRNGTLWKCFRTAGAKIDCLSASINITELFDIASFNGELYVANENGVHICNWSKLNVTTCSPYVYHDKTRSIAIAYETYKMQTRYENEHSSCTWQSNDFCPPFVTYYGQHERSTLEVHVRNGRLYNSQGFLVDTRNANSGAAIFAMGPDGRVLLSNVHLRGLVHTSSLFAGNPVAGAGRMVVLNGVVKNITTCSEHYRPDLNLNRQVVQSLRSQGYTDHIDSLECSENIDGQTGSNNVQ